MKNLIFGNGLILELQKILCKENLEDYYVEFLKKIYLNHKNLQMNSLHSLHPLHPMLSNVRKIQPIQMINNFQELQKSNNFENSLLIFVKKFFPSTMFKQEMSSNNNKLVHFVVDKDNEISYKMYELVEQFKKILTEWKKIFKMNISISNDEPISEDIVFQDIKHKTSIDHTNEKDLEECLEKINSILDLNVFFSSFDKFFTTNYTKIEYLFYFPIEIYFSLIDFRITMNNNSFEQQKYFSWNKIETSYSINIDNFPPSSVKNISSFVNKSFDLKDLLSIKIPNFVKEELKNKVEKIKIQLKKIFWNSSLFNVNNLLITKPLSIEHFNQISIISNDKKTIFALHEGITIPDYESKKDLIEDLKNNNSWINKKYINNLKTITSKINQNDTTIFYGFNPLNDWYILNLIELKKNKVIFCIYNNEFSNWEKIISNFKSFEKKDFKLVGELNEWIEKEKP